MGEWVVGEGQGPDAFPGEPKAYLRNHDTVLVCLDIRSCGATGSISRRANKTWQRTCGQAVHVVLVHGGAHAAQGVLKRCRMGWRRWQVGWVRGWIGLRRGQVGWVRGRVCEGGVG